MNNKTKTHNLYKIIFVLVVFLGIGYAFLEAGLNINGDTTVAQPEFNTYVQNVSVTTGSTSGTPTIVGNDKKEVDFSTALTNDGNSFYEETTTLTNHGSEKAYIKSVDVKVYDSSNNEITLSAPYEYSLTHGDGTPVDNADEIASGSTITYKFKFNYISGTDMNTVTDYPTYTFKITYNYKKDIIDLPSDKSKDTLQVGDEICIKGECFNFLHYDGTNNEDIVMLAKYNLKVGYIYDKNVTKIGEYTSSDPGYNKQSSEVRGWLSGQTRNGIVRFSKTAYWDDNGTLKSEYPGSYDPGPDYPTVYDPVNYKGAPEYNEYNKPTNPNYSVAYYVEAYKDILSNYGVTIKDARLLTHAEVTDSSIGCSLSNDCPTNGFISNTSFWLGSVWRLGGVYYITSSGDFSAISYDEVDDLWNYRGRLGVRPVIVISKSNI